MTGGGDRVDDYWINSIWSLLARKTGTKFWSRGERKRSESSLKEDNGPDERSAAINREKGGSFQLLGKGRYQIYDIGK